MSTYSTAVNLYEGKRKENKIIQKKTQETPMKRLATRITKTIQKQKTKNKNKNNNKNKNRTEAKNFRQNVTFSDTIII